MHFQAKRVAVDSAIHDPSNRTIIKYLRLDIFSLGAEDKVEWLVHISNKARALD